jgi:hypothetical protein
VSSPPTFSPPTNKPTSSSISPTQSSGVSPTSIVSDPSAASSHSPTPIDSQDDSASPDSMQQVVTPTIADTTSLPIIQPTGLLNTELATPVPTSPRPTPSPTAREISTPERPMLPVENFAVIESGLDPSNEPRPVSVGLYVIISGEDPRNIAWELFQDNVSIRRREFGTYNEEGVFYDSELVDSGSIYTFVLQTRSEAGSGSGECETSNSNS